MNNSRHRHCRSGFASWQYFTALFIINICISTPLQATEGQASEALPESLEVVDIDPLAAADTWSAKWEHQKALDALENSAPDDAEVLWRQARSHIDIGETLDGDAALAQFEIARTEAEMALEQAPDNAQVHQILGIVYGRIALYKGVFKSIGLAKKIRLHANRAIVLNDSMPRSMYVLGRLHMELSKKPGIALKLLGLGWVDEDSVGYYFNRALQQNPNLIQTRVTFAEHLLEQEEDIDVAMELLGAAVEMVITDEQDDPFQRRAKEMLRDLR